MRKIKTAIIGINKYSHSKQIVGSVRKQDDIFDVVGYVLPENERERIPERIDTLDNLKELMLDEVLNDNSIEAVVIETDEIYLTKYALLCAKAGKHIHMEKPGGISLPDFEKLISVMKQTGKVFSTGYMYRHNPFVVDLLQKIKNGELGEILSVEAQMSCILPPSTREWLSTLYGGMMFYLGCHLIDLVLQIQGQPKRIIPLNKSSRLDGISSLDSGFAVFEYENGTSFVKTTAVEIGGYARRQFVVTGSKGTIELKPFEMYDNGQYHYTEKTEYHSSKWNNRGEFTKTPPFDRYDTMMKRFAKYVRGEKTNPYTLDYELELYKTIHKCCE